MDMFILNSLYLNPKQNEWNNEESKHNMPFKNALLNSLKLGHKISEQAEDLCKEHVPHPLLTFLDSNKHAAFTVTHYHYTGRTW